MGKREKHFVLVHGACHGAWCWYKVTTLLKSNGHKVTALNLAASGIHPKQVLQLPSISDYYQPLMEFMDSLPSEDKVILVAHSLGGVSVSVAMERFPHKISLAVFVTAMMPSQQLTYPDFLHQKLQVMSGVDYMDTHFTYDNGPHKPPTSRLFGPKFMESMLYQLSPPEDLSLALSLLRPVPIYNDLELLLKETAVTEQRHGRVPRVYIDCDRDNLKNEDAQRWMIEINPPLEVKVIAGSDHMPMFSKPLELCSYLLEFADRY
ncbi:salicylic acid-binding protein 2-like [Senna tora]|uniref:(S)-hydroxynitrile lyase n=1 Tax=Senna tora TaxID=362788 RepID=A0A834SUK1_9FABA|nr:salicylic acid-binding protein 2-like [Senna tora]